MEVRKTAIEKLHSPQTVKWIVKNKDKLRFDLAIQRNKVWNHDQKSLFIHSLIYGYPIPPCYAKESDDGLLWMLDGKQRLTTVIDFIEGEFELSPNTPEVWGEDITGKYFADLPEEMQDEILDTTIVIYKLKGMTEDEIHEMFYRLNNGSALTKFELTRAITKPSVLQVVNEIASHPFFIEKIQLSTSAKNRFVDQELVFQILKLLYKSETGFSSKEIAEFAHSLDVITQETKEQVLQLADYISEAADKLTDKELKKALKKVHIPMLFITAIEAISRGITATDFGVWMKDFLVDNYKPGSAYASACTAGSAKKENVQKRITEMKKHFNKYFKNMMEQTA